MVVVAARAPHAANTTPSLWRHRGCGSFAKEFVAWSRGSVLPIVGGRDDLWPPNRQD
jgi:hypothetical protein